MDSVDEVNSNKKGCVLMVLDKICWNINIKKHTNTNFNMTKTSVWCSRYMKSEIQIEDNDISHKSDENTFQVYD